jgi:hypothetical protein
VQVIQYLADSIEEILFFSVGGSITHIWFWTLWVLMCSTEIMSKRIFATELFVVHVSQPKVYRLPF